jgi:hypothetical protein
VLCGIAGGVGLYLSARRASVDALRDRAERLDPASAGCSPTAP